MANNVTTPDFITVASLLTYSGAALAMFTIVTFLRSVSEWVAKHTVLVGFPIALALALGIAVKTETLKTPLDGVVLVVNAILLFNAASGTQQLAAVGSRVRKKEDLADADVGGAGKPQLQLFASWWG